MQRDGKILENVMVGKRDALDIGAYFQDFQETLAETLAMGENSSALMKAAALIRRTKEEGRKIILIGNGGSSAIAEHMAIDFTKNAKLRAIAISGSPQLTTFANDYGYEYVYSKAVEAYADAGDVLVAISSGGSSPNILHAAEIARKLGCSVITFSAFESDNPLRQKGDVNLYVPSRAYGYIEIIHNLLIHFINDHIIGSAVYQFR